MQMPDMGGVDVIKRYQAAQSGASSLPFMMLTANATIDAQEQCKKLGVSAFLTKPVRSGQLVRIVDEVMQGESLSRRDQAEGDEPGLADEDAERQALIIDVAVLEDLAKLSRTPDFLHQLVEKFYLDSDQLLEHMRTAAKTRKLSDYAEAAHALAGNAAGMGAHTLKAICSSAALLDQEQFNELADSLFAETSAAYTLTQQALAEYLASRNASGMQ
jgi:two-component system sensor histidine kinase RpfC